jgi:uncharacterized protein with FMN-binding domain
MKKRNQVFSAILALAMMMNLSLVPAYAAESSTTYKDGTYTAIATVNPDEYEDFEAYDISVDVTIEHGAISTVAYSGGSSFGANGSYARRAMDGYKTSTGVASQIVTKQSTDVDAVSTATCSSGAIITAVNAALEQAANAADAEKETFSGYVLMNIPYSDFYAAEGISEQVDVISTATANKFKGGLAKGTYNDGTNISGVQSYPVAMDQATYELLKDQVTDESADYYFTLCTETPASYKTLTYDNDNGVYTFSAATGTQQSAAGLSVDDFTTTSSYGSYQISLLGVGTNGTIGNEENVTISGVILTTSDGKSYPMYTLENVWLGTKVDNVEIAWSVAGAPEVKKNHGNGDAFHQYDMNGKTLTNVKLITSAGIYNIPCNLALTPYYEGEVTMGTANKNTITVTGLPADIQNAKATVSYTVGTGRNAKTVYVAKNAAVAEDGGISLDTPMEAGKTYTVTITSSNYAQITDTVAIPVTYLYAALTWEEYWASENVYAAGDTTSSEEKDSKGETDKGAFDVVSRATTNHGLHRGSFQSVAVIYDTNGKTYAISHWTDSDTAVLTDGTTLKKSSDRSTGITTLTLEDGTTAQMDHYEITGIKYVPVQVATEDLEAFSQQYTVVANGGTLAGGFSEQNLTAYTAVAAVDAYTNGLKTATKNSDGTFSFSARATGTGSGLKDAALKTVDESKITFTVKEASGSYGEFLRVDLTGEGYGDLGSNLYAVVWTYYGSDSSYQTALQSYGTKFAADNWMHKSMGIQLGLTDSLRCQLPEGTDGTGYWTITLCAMGYEDYTVAFQAAAENIVKAEEEETVDTSALASLVAQAQALKESDYTPDSWKNLSTELSESVELLAKADATQAAIDEQVTHLTAAMNELVKATQPDDKDDDQNNDQNNDQNTDTTCPSEDYVDLDNTKWYHTCVDYVISNGLMIGDGKGHFTPQATVTRAMVAQILYNQAGKPAVSGKSPFTDVAEGQWYTDAILWAYEQGIVKGYGNGTCGPKDAITREQLATILWRAAGEQEPTQTALKFTDAGDASDYAVKALLWANEQGLMEGYGNGTLKPKGNTVRVEAAKMIMVYCER